MMREDAHEEKSEMGPGARALMQTYVNDSVQPGTENTATASTSGTAGPEGRSGTGSGLPEVV